MENKAANKIEAQKKLTDVASLLVITFGEKEAAKMLRNAARMVQPDKDESK